MAKKMGYDSYSNASSGGKKIGDGYTATSADKSWKSGTGNVTESRLNSGGDQKWGTAMKAKKPKRAGAMY